MKQGKTLEQLGQELERQRNSRADFIANTRQLQFKTENNESRITFESGNKTMDFGINPLAHQLKLSILLDSFFSPIFKLKN